MDEKERVNLALEALGQITDNHSEALIQAAKTLQGVETALKLGADHRETLEKRLVALEEMVKEGEEDVKIAIEALQGISEAQDETKNLLAALDRQIKLQDKRIRKLLLGNEGN